MPPNIHRAIAPEIVGKLGQVSDRELARLSGLSPYVIKQARLAKGIDPVSRGYDLPDDLVQKLGKVPDAQLTDEYGVPGPVLCRARQDRSIPRYRVLHKPDSSEYVPFQSETLALLGKIPDVELASQFGRSLREVKQERDVRGIDPYTKGRNLPDELVEQLGLVPDSVLVRLYSVSAATIKRAREARSIAKFRPSKSSKSDHRLAQEQEDPSCPRSTLPTSHLLNVLPHTLTDTVWTPEVLGQLGQIKDREIAKAVGISPSTVCAKRNSLGIPPVLAGRWTVELVSLLGQISDKELAERSGGALTENSVCKARLHRKIPVCQRKVPTKAESAEVRALLGVVNDYEIARRTGVGRSEITRQRLKLKIAPAKLGRLPRRKPQVVVSPTAKTSQGGFDAEANAVERIWSEEEDALLGTAEDSKVAGMLKIDFWSVFYRRKAMSIPPYEYAYS